MRSQPALPSEKYVWGTLAPRIEGELKIQTLPIWQLCGVFDMYGPLGENFTGFAEGSELIKELTGILVWALALDLSSRQYGIAKRGVGRPPDLMTPTWRLRCLLVTCVIAVPPDDSRCLLPSTASLRKWKRDLFSNT